MGRTSSFLATRQTDAFPVSSGKRPGSSDQDFLLRITEEEEEEVVGISRMAQASLLQGLLDARDAAMLRRIGFIPIFPMPWRLTKLYFLPSCSG